jgi:hypothetical protein
MSNFNLERRVHIKPEQEHPTLYRWYLQEHDASGAPVGEKYIPWNWSIDFRASFLKYTSAVGLDKFRSAAETLDEGASDRSARANKWFQTQRISGDFSPVADRWGRKMKLGFFGTSRTLSHVSVEIDCDDSILAPTFSGFASPSYETEDAEMVKYHEADFCGFNIRLPRSQFEDAKGLLLGGLKVGAGLSLSGVRGLYSPWTPTVVTNEIRILPDGQEVLGVDELGLALTGTAPRRLFSDSEPIDGCYLWFTHALRTVDIEVEERRRRKLYSPSSRDDFQ